MLNRKQVLLVILTVKELLERFTKKICKKKKIKNSIESKKISREKGLLKEWKGYDNCFSS